MVRVVLYIIIICIYLETYTVTTHEYVEKFLALDKLNFENCHNAETKTGREKGRYSYLVILDFHPASACHLKPTVNKAQFSFLCSQTVSIAFYLNNL